MSADVVRLGASTDGHRTFLRLTVEPDYPDRVRIAGPAARFWTDRRGVYCPAVIALDDLAVAAKQARTSRISISACENFADESRTFTAVALAEQRGRRLIRLMSASVAEQRVDPDGPPLPGEVDVDADDLLRAVGKLTVIATRGGTRR